MRKPIIVGNWKLNKTSQEAVSLIKSLRVQLDHVTDVDIAVCPVFTALSAAKSVLQGSSIGLGAQDLYWDDEGAFTGEVSAPLLKAEGVQYVIIGHSERRQFFAETNEIVNKKIRAALKHGLTPIVCVGESLSEREANKTFHVNEEQIRKSLSGFKLEELAKLVIAYEPVWAIGTGKTATSAQAQEVHQFIRGLLAEISNDKIAKSVRIQYGGSVKPENTTELMSQADIDGALVGGASLKSECFIQIVTNSCGVIR